MHTHEMAEAIRTCAVVALDDLTRALWAGHAAGHFTDQDATVLAEAIQARRNAAQAGLRRPATNHRHRSQRPPERSVAIERRRRLAASGVMPPALASRFTTAELAALKVISDDVRSSGTCMLPIDAIAARAGVSRTSVQNAIRQACRLGMLERQERRRAYDRSLPSILLVVDREWLAWLKRGPKGGGLNSSSTTGTGIQGKGLSGQWKPKKAAERERGACEVTSRDSAEVATTAARAMRSMHKQA